MIMERKKFSQPTQVDSILGRETGRRQPSGWSRSIVIMLCITWSLLQLWIASPFPFLFNIGIFNDTQARSLHLAFALLLSFLVFPRTSGSNVAQIPIYDYILAIVSSLCAAYIYINYYQLTLRPGDPLLLDLMIALLGLVVLLEATRRTAGWPLTIIAFTALSFSYLGPYLPDLIAHKGGTLTRIANHQWLSTEGVFGVPIGVSTSFVYLFVLFGALLEKAGAGQYFINVAFALVGHLRGGAGKASVLASGLTGIASGSSIANVVTTGTFTIPLMKKSGYPAYKAGAIEVASSTNGQLMPPVMGAAAFLIVEYVNIPYQELIKHAALPALLSYIALFYVVHLEAIKLNLFGMKKADIKPWTVQLLAWTLVISLIVALVCALNLVLNVTALSLSPGYITFFLIITYLILLYLANKNKEKYDIDPSDPDQILPPVWDVLLQGLYFTLPIVVLVWCLILNQLSPGLSAFYASMATIAIMITERPIKAILNKNFSPFCVYEVGQLLCSGMEYGARNMIGIAVATAAAGIVVGTVSLTGIGQVLTEVIEILSLGSLPLMFVITAIICMLLGMGLPTTANYIVVSTLMAPVIITLSNSQGVVIPLVAIHLFVFYFGIMADDTPPVGLAAYAASGISGANPLQTGIQSFTYDLRTALLPFMFIVNPHLLLIGVEGVGETLWTVTTALIAMLLFVSAIQRYYFTNLSFIESIVLVTCAVVLFVPNAVNNQFNLPYQNITLDQAWLEKVKNSNCDYVRVHVNTQTERRLHQRIYRLPIEKNSPLPVPQQWGVNLRRENGEWWVSSVNFMSAAEQVGLSGEYEHHITALELCQEQPSEVIFSIITLFFLVLYTLWRLNQKKLLKYTHSD